MRRPSRWARLTPDRIRHRDAYAGYLASPAWHTVRETWLDEHSHRTGTDPQCVICDTAWTLRDDLHHRTYRNLGREAFDDLVPMCRGCHERLHTALDRSPTWRHVSLERATDLIVGRLREDRS